MVKNRINTTIKQTQIPPATKYNDSSQKLVLFTLPEQFLYYLGYWSYSKSCKLCTMTPVFVGLISEELLNYMEWKNEKFLKS